MADKKYKYKGWIIYIEDTSPRVASESEKEYDVKIWSEKDPSRFSDVNKSVPHNQLEGSISEAKKLIKELVQNKPNKAEKTESKPYSQATIELLDEIIENAQFLKNRLMKGLKL